MNHSNEDHLLRLHGYLLNSGCDKPGMNVIKTGIMSRCRAEFLAEKIDPNKMCPHCFHHWSEGDFILKFRSRNSKRKKKVKLFVWKMKCSNCGKQTEATCKKPSNKFNQTSKKKTISTDLKIHQLRKKINNVERSNKPRRNTKKEKILPPSREQKKRLKNLFLKKKSNLPYLKDFL